MLAIGVVGCLLAGCSGQPTQRTPSPSSVPHATPVARGRKPDPPAAANAPAKAGEPAAAAVACASADVPNTNQLASARSTPGVIELYARYGAASTFVMMLRPDGALTFRVPANGGPLFPEPEIGLFAAAPSADGQQLHASLGGALPGLKGVKTLRPGEASWWVVAHARTGNVERSFRLFETGGEFQSYQDAILQQVRARWPLARLHTVAAGARWVTATEPAAGPGELAVRVDLQSTGRSSAVLGGVTAPSSWRLVPGNSAADLRPVRLRVLTPGLADCPLVSIAPGSRLTIELVFSGTVRQGQLVFVPVFPKGRTASDSWVAGTVTAPLLPQ